MRMEDAWAHGGDEGRGKLRKAVERSTHPFEPQIAEWGNPAVTDSHSFMESEPWELKHLSTGRKEKSIEMS